VKILARTRTVEKPEVETEPITEVPETEAEETQEEEAEEEKTPEEPLAEVNVGDVQPIAKFRMTATRETFEAIFKAIATITDEANFHVSKEGLTLRMMDTSHVAMIDFKYVSNRLDEYLFDVEGSFKFDIEEMQKIIKRADKEDSITIETNPDKAKVTVTIAGGYERIFNLPLLEASEEQVPVPKIEWRTTIKTTVEAIKKALGDVALVTDHVKILTDKETVKFEGRGDLAEADITLKKGSDQLFNIETDEHTTAVYSLSYLQSFTNAVKDTVATISYATDLPLKFDVSNGLGNITFYLAPRIETE